MFFIIGISNKKKDLELAQSILCRRCGHYGRYNVFMTYTVLLLFFIPCFRWNRQYYVQSSCCGALYKLDPQVGRRIKRGESIEIVDEDLQPVGNSGGFARSVRRCDNCGYETDEDFSFCPKCGQELK